MLSEAAAILGKYLDVQRVGYAKDLGDGETVSVTRNYTDGVPSIEGTYRYEDYGAELLAELRQGRSLLRNDIARDPTLSDAESLPPRVRHQTRPPVDPADHMVIPVAPLRRTSPRQPPRLPRHSSRNHRIARLRAVAPDSPFDSVSLLKPPKPTGFFVFN